MSAFHDNALTGASGQGAYQIERSLRFNSADSPYLSRTPASAGNRKTWTWAGWVKRSAISGNNYLIVAESSFSDRLHFVINSADLIGGYGESGGTYFSGATTAVFRDPSAWYHIVLLWDTTQAIPADRFRVYVNGVLQGFNFTTTPTQNRDGNINSNQDHFIGAYPRAADYANFYLADCFLIDGQALDPTSFGFFDTNGIWQPKTYEGTYGTNGFHLPFNDNSTAAALGTDAAGSNDWAVSNISVAAGAGNDSLVDSPTNYGTDTGAGGEVRGNYATLNPLAKGGGITLSNGNLDISSTTYGNNTATFFLTSGKWYWEGQGTGYVAAICGKAGINWATSISAAGSNSIGWWHLGPVYWDGGNNGGGTGYTSSDVTGIALDMDAGVVYFYKNGSLVYTITFGSGTVPDLSDGVFPCFNNGISSGTTHNAVYNFGQRPFAYPAPSGFKALNTPNLPTSTIADGSTAMDVALYTGNGGTQTISGLGFSPDLVWLKARNNAYIHGLFDAVRGTGKGLVSNTIAAEVTYDAATSFNSDGFTNGVDFNGSSTTYVAWTWDAGSSTVTNNDGTITSQVRANPSAGFSVATLTTPGSGTFTVGHGLNVAPSLVICKSRNQSFTWIVYHRSAGAGNALVLNSTAASNPNATIWQNTDPSSTLVYGNVASWGTADYVMYSFAPVEGYSAFGTYTGNGSTEGRFVYTGTLSRWILIKRTDTTSNWTILDTAREGYNVDNDPLYPNVSDAEGTADLADILSNGFKLRTTDASVNASAGTYIYAAFAENPFALARAR